MSGGWGTWGWSLTPLLSDHQITGLRSCWRPSTCNRLSLKLGTRPVQLQPMCLKLVGSLIYVVFGISIINASSATFSSEIFCASFSVFFLFFPFLSGGRGLEAADATATLADSGIASPGLHPSLSWQGSAPGLQNFSGQPGPGHLQHMPWEGATQHPQPASVSACETFLLWFWPLLCFIYAF